MPAISIHSSLSRVSISSVWLLQSENSTKNSVTRYWCLLQISVSRSSICIHHTDLIESVIGSGTISRRLPENIQILWSILSMLHRRPGFLSYQSMEMRGPRRSKKSRDILLSRSKMSTQKVELISWKPSSSLALRWDLSISQIRMMAKYDYFLVRGRCLSSRFWSNSERSIMMGTLLSR